MRKKNSIYLFCCPLSHVLSSFGHNFCSRAPIEKKNIYSHEANLFFYLQKNISKNHDKNLARMYLLKIPFVPQIDNGPLGINFKVSSTSHFGGASGIYGLMPPFLMSHRL